MAFLEFKNIRIAGISTAVPKKAVDNINCESKSSDYDSATFVESTGVRVRRVDSICTSDLGQAAAEKLISDLGWEKSEIGALIFVSQTPDYLFPSTACLLQDRLGLSKECYANDSGLGCSGWTYGISQLASLMTSGDITKGLLIVGDAKRVVDDDDPLFGYAATATALEFVAGEKGFRCHYGTDGSGYDAIIVPDGGCRNGVSSKSFELENVDNKFYNRLQCRMNGMDVFSFGISVPPKSIKKLAEHYGFDYLDADYFVFHQANKKMNDLMTRKLKLPEEKVPSSIEQFGNTSSASIPLTICTQLKGKFENKPTKFICCGFGIGLSWGTIAFETNNIIISDLIEL